MPFKITESFLSSIAKKIIVSFSLLFLLSACITTPNLDAYVNKDQINQYDPVIYTIVYQGLAPESEMDIFSRDLNGLEYFHLLDTKYYVNERVENNETKYTTTWRATFAVIEDGVRTIPSIEVEGFNTPEIKLNVMDVKPQSWATWEVKDYKTTTSTATEIEIRADVTVNNNALDDVFVITPNLKYDDVNVSFNQKTQYTNDNKTLEIYATYSFDKPGTYIFSPFGILSVVERDGIKTSIGSDAPPFTITVP